MIMMYRATLNNIRSWTNEYARSQSRSQLDEYSWLRSWAGSWLMSESDSWLWSDNDDYWESECL